MTKGGADADLPAELMGKPEAAVLYRNLENILMQSAADTSVQEMRGEYGDPRTLLALKLDQTMREKAPANWKGDEIKERQVLNALFPIMSRDRMATQAIFEIIKNQAAY